MDTENQQSDLDITHGQVQQEMMGMGSKLQNERMEDGREEIVYQPSTTVLYEKIVKPEIPRRFNGESNLGID